MLRLPIRSINLINFNFMANVCQICQRKTRIKISRSHSNIAFKKRQYVNLQTKVVDGKRIKICTKCLKKEFRI